MGIIRLKPAWTLASLVLIAIVTTTPRLNRAQEKDGDSTSTASKTSTSSDKVKLSDVTRVSTDEATRQAAKEKAKTAQTSSAKPDSGKEKADQGNAGASPVSELQPAKKANDDKGATEIPTDVEKSNARKIHGSVGGATGSGARQGGAELGGGTKSGKTHVYVETERSSTPQPH